jgi:glycosyltransferase involved in cell wall biosynthesis
MKILHLIYDHVNNPWVGGGGAVRVYEIYKKIGNRHDVTIMCGKFPGGRNYDEDNLKFRFVGTDKGYILSTFAYAWQANRFVRKHYADYDIIIEDFAPWNPVFSHLIKERPVVLQIQNYMGKEILNKYFVAGIPFYLMERFYPRFFKNWIVLLDNLNKRFHINGKVIPQGIPGEYLQTDIIEGKYAAFLGRIDIHQKGLDILSNAIKTVTIKLKIAGDGRDRGRFLGMIKDSANVEWVGMVKGAEKIKFLEEASFLIAPSRFEGQGIVVLEAAAFGKPVVVSDIPEFRYAVDNGFGLSFRAGDTEDLTSKIKLLLGNESMREEMGNKAREYAENFRWDKIAGEYEKFLIRVGWSE